MPEPRTFRVINRRMVNSLARSLDLPIGESVAAETELGVSKVVSARFKRTRSVPPLSDDDPRLMPLITEALRDSGQLRIDRPLTAGQFWSNDEGAWFVWEDTVLTPVTLPLKRALPKGVKAPAALNVWVGDPPPRPAEGHNEWDFSTSYLFLVEELGEFTWPGGWFVSGISSLRLVAEFLFSSALDDMESLHRASASEDAFGRWNPVHPIEKLKRAGGIAGAPRRVETVYKIAYATDEQSDSLQGRPRRVSDVLGYPLYIVC